MSKTLELIRTLIDGANEYEKKTGNTNPTVYLSKNNLLIIEKALQRLESIDNAEPSEALECLEKLKGMEISSMPFSDEYGTQEVDLNDIRKVGSQLNTDFREYTATIKQALLKQQELPEPFKTGVDIGVIKPKQYLKWEDLEFNHTPKMFDVKMNGNKYKLVVGYNGAGKNLVILRNDKQPYYFLKYDKQFFNDLHLERVEE